MNDQLHSAEPGASALAALCRVAPPPALRAHLLRRHGRRRALVRALPLVAVAALAFALYPGVGPAPDTGPIDWQARSMMLEADWRQHGDATWLLADARAQPLLQQLRFVDEELQRTYLRDTDDAAHRTRLWRQRSETLAQLIDSRRQGGMAVAM